MPPRASTWSTPAFLNWLIVVAGASVIGAVVTVVAAPASSGGDMFDSAMLPLTLFVLTVLCGFAGGFVPAAGPYWGLVPVLPYLFVFAMQMSDAPAEDATFAPVSIVLLLMGLAVPWAAGFSVGLARTAGRK